jgi:AraC-like DNA-binding protein
MMLAANLLCGTNMPLARIAEDVGYQTDTAFSRAFRREFGAPPAAWRRIKAGRDRVQGELPGGRGDGRYDGK